MKITIAFIGCVSQKNDDLNFVDGKQELKAFVWTVCGLSLNVNFTEQLLKFKIWIIHNFNFDKRISSETLLNYSVFPFHLQLWCSQRISIILCHRAISWILCWVPSPYHKKLHQVRIQSMPSKMIHPKIKLKV